MIEISEEDETFASPLLLAQARRLRDALDHLLEIY